MDYDLAVMIVGGGIGGLVTALQLHADGFKNITIFEASRSISPIGSGINLQPSAILVLRNLGLLPALEATGIKTASLNYYNLHGNPIVSEPRGVAAGYLVPQFSIHRGELHNLLLAAVKNRLGAASFKTDHTLTAFTQTPTDVTATFIRRSNPTQPPAHPTFTASILIAADGINSTIRSLLYPDEGPPNFSGRLLWRGVTEQAPYMDGASMIWAGHADQKFIAYPVSSRSARKSPPTSSINWIAELRVRSADDPDKTPPVADWGKAVPKSRFDAQFGKWTFGFLSIPDLIASTDVVYEFPMCDRDPVVRWSFGRVTMLGDAAHPLYPIGSNGASQAILDCVALSEALLQTLGKKGTEALTVEEALVKYEQERLPPTAKICIANRGNGPDHVLQLAHEKAPDGFENIEDVISKVEVEEVGKVYKMLAGFDIETVNKKAKETEGIAESRGLKSPDMIS